MANGVAIKGVGNRCGNRFIAHDRPSARGGKRVRGSYDSSKAPYLHLDASVAKEMKLAASVSLFDGQADDDHFVT